MAEVIIISQEEKKHSIRYNVKLIRPKGSGYEKSDETLSIYWPKAWGEFPLAISVHKE